jgi:hypothetical protein
VSESGRIQARLWSWAVDLTRRLWYEDPWRSLLQRCGRASFPVTPVADVRIARFWSPVVGAVVALGGVAGKSGLAGRLVLILVGVALAISGVAWAWRAPSFSSRPLEALDVAPGDIYCGDTNTSGETGDVVFANVARVVIAVFHHHGRSATAVRLALGDGQARYFARTDTVRVLEPEDVFFRIRPDSPDHFEFPVPASADARDMLVVLWDAQCNGYNGAELMYLEESLATWRKERVTATVEECKGLRLVLPITKGIGRHKTIAYQLSTAGEIVLAAAMRAIGKEVYTDAEEKQLTNITNYGNLFSESPGAAGVVGSGSASATGTNHFPANVLRALQELVSADLTDITGLSRETKDEVGRSLCLIDEEIAREAPDVTRVKRAVRNVQRLAGDVAVGALGSATWAVLASWAGMH